MTILMIVELAMLVHKIQTYGILWFFTTMRQKGNKKNMKTITILLIIIDFILLVASIMNLIKANKYLNIETNNLEELIKEKEKNLKATLKICEYKYILNEIAMILYKTDQLTSVDRCDKIKEVIQLTNKNNF